MDVPTPRRAPQTVATYRMHASPDETQPDLPQLGVDSLGPSGTPGDVYDGALPHLFVVRLGRRRRVDELGEGGELGVQSLRRTCSSRI